MENLELARLVLKQAETEPELFYMGAYARVTPCGTKACLAGHAMLQSGCTFNQLRGFIRPDGTLVQHEAEEAIRLLGLSNAEYYPSQYKYYLFHGLQSSAEAITRFRSLIEAEEARRQAVPE